MTKAEVHKLVWVAETFETYMMQDNVRRFHFFRLFLFGETLLSGHSRRRTGSRKSSRIFSLGLKVHSFASPDYRVKQKF